MRALQSFLFTGSTFDLTPIHWIRVLSKYPDNPSSYWQARRSSELATEVPA
jgi:hypothetical protein